MKFMKKYAAAALAAITAMGALGGCKQLEEKSAAETVAVTFGDTDIMLDEIEYRVRAMEYSYEIYFGSDICSSDLGDGSGMTVGDYIIEIVLEQLRQTLVLNEYAEQNGIALTESQQQLVTDAIEEFLGEDADYLDAIGATRELVEKDYTQNAIANAVYLKLVEGVDTTVGDDEFLRKKIAYVRLTPSELTETTAAEEAATLEETSEELSEDGSEEESSAEAADSTYDEEDSSEETAAGTDAEEESSASEEAESETGSQDSEETEEETTEEETLSPEEQERQDAMDAAAQEILEKFEDGMDAADFVSDYQNDSHFTATNSEISISEDGSAVYISAAWPLATDECTIYNNDDGSIYIIRCLDDNDEEARQTAIDSEIESRKTELFEEQYADIQDSSSKFKVDEDAIAQISFSQPVYVEPTEEESSSEEETGSEEASVEEIETASEEESFSSEPETTEEESPEASEAESDAESEEESTSEE